MLGESDNDGCPTALPVTLTQFNGKKVESTIVLHWEVSAEVNNDFYIVERSTNEQNFIKIGQVDGKVLLISIKGMILWMLSPKKASTTTASNK